ncbi:hypothetical protein D2T33_11510 [Sinirhodobacter populi]|uniref:DeoR-like transcriptional repressor C-terminal sensor domain-containing protein n=1 Tax=Paenirhodobacter populi TaxID=2306993 RepID=A0A443ITG9_9RHOB|nr:hypothetical protein D2T33_11510 [Sinirhodobacter populi]
MAQALPQHSNLTVITNDIDITNIMRFSPGSEIIVSGGTLRRTDDGHLGDLTAQFFGQFKPDFAVMGCPAGDSDGDMSDFDLPEVRVDPAILWQARRRFIVDHGKFRRSAPARIANLTDVDTLITDRLLAPALEGSVGRRYGSHRPFLTRREAARPVSRGRARQ